MKGRTNQMKKGSEQKYRYRSDHREHLGKTLLSEPSSSSRTSDRADHTSSSFPIQFINNSKATIFINIRFQDICQSYY